MYISIVSIYYINTCTAGPQPPNHRKNSRGLGSDEVSPQQIHCIYRRAAWFKKRNPDFKWFQGLSHPSWSATFSEKSWEWLSIPLHFQASRNCPHKTRSPTKALSTARCWQWHSTSVKSRDHSLGCWPQAMVNQLFPNGCFIWSPHLWPFEKWTSLYLPKYKRSPNGQQITDFVWFCDSVDKTPCLNHFSQKKNRCITIPETNTSKICQIGHQKEISFSNHPFSDG